MTTFIADKKEYLSTTFNELDLPGYELTATEFEGCTFNECNFNESIFNNCKFIDCQFIKCNLSILKIMRSKFLNVVFDQCKIVGVDWTTASWSSLALSSPIMFYKCILNDSFFFGVALPEIAIEECKANEVDFRSGNFDHANFSGTDFSRSMFNETNLSYADFTDASNYSIDVNFNRIKGAKFCRDEAINLLESLGIELVD